MTSDEMAATVASAGGCKIVEVVTSPMRPMNNRLYMTWVQLPLAQTVRVVSKEKNMTDLLWLVLKL